ncbi:MAG: ribonuclease III [Candidatus Woykebacteria bacterium RBG_13_40_7b]|uniref:Ribonuclease 3 n=1 Tax=Candidatus Woykebacteria bacterium RBG_13_40_7b TaxID=1802594 RepID=A0A1G1W7I3_9BACT|nr:MAG: ribonuclease III [Candidatus Woykebacteria bacterium RBG_13_40_7b]
MDLAELEKNINIKFKNKDLLRNAFIHRSYLNENSKEKLPSNERLEFLGDSVLSLVTSEYLYQKYEDRSEGDLTSFRASLVNSQALSKVAGKLGLGNHLYLSRGEEGTGGRSRQYLLANTLEALIGALYFDQGIKVAEKFIKKHILVYLNEIISNESYRDFKSRLQELAQEKHGITPTYKVLAEEGPDHAKKFTLGVMLQSKLLASGNGKSKQEAEQRAAQEALESWNDSIE